MCLENKKPTDLTKKAKMKAAGASGGGGGGGGVGVTPFGAMLGKKSLLGGGAGGGMTGAEAHGILEGISSLHSWIKTQTMIRPQRGGGGGRVGGRLAGIYDEVRREISLKDPFA